PRRFGKSLLVDTLKCLFEGKKELFQGLYIYDKWDWNTKYPVIRIDLSKTKYMNTEQLVQKLIFLLEQLYAYHGIPFEKDMPAFNSFDNLIQKVCQKYGQKVVILIDEYDKPIIDCLTEVEVAKANRMLLRSVYSVIKGSDEYIRFAFITGVSKFSKVSLFSDLNNFMDITIHRNFSTLCGYTHQDVLTHFADYLEGVDIERVKKWYNGYSWNTKAESVYNPYDILLFLHSREYRSHWFETGTSSFLIDLIEKGNCYLPSLENTVSDELLLSTFDIEDLYPEAVLWQTGYLTIKEELQVYDTIEYRLGYPNFEVEQSLNRVLLRHYLRSSKSKYNPVASAVVGILSSGDMQGLRNQLNSLLSSVSYTYSTVGDLGAYEGFYASVLYAYFKGLGIESVSEDVTSIGRIDLTLFAHPHIYIFEFKMKHHGQGALEQIRHKRYYEKYLSEGRIIYLVGIVFDVQTR
ncbi:MAG: AAA family ATPase, partial [Bacteroidia bacterium]|nr:AAA family ATPase [Bacteroidia bacterium]